MRETLDVSEFPNEPMADLSNKVSPRERNLAMLSMAVGSFIFGTAEFAVMGLLPSVAESFHAPVSSASRLIAAYALGVVVGGPLLAVSCSKMAPKSLLLLLLVIFSIGNLGQTLMPHLVGTEIMRFISGMPHGAYFGVASLIAASLMPASHRGRAIGIVLSGIMLATVVGVPLCTYISTWISWKFLYASLNVVVLVCMVMIYFTVPYSKPIDDIGESALNELKVLKNPQVLMTLFTGAIGFGGMFGVYTFLTVVLKDVTGLSITMITIAQVVWGLGMLFGNNLGGALADKNLNLTVVASLVMTIVFLCAYSFFMSNQWATIALCFLIPSVAIILAVGLQTRMTLIAHEGQTLAASLHHSAFNAANALGSIVATLLLSKGYGMQSLGYGSSILTCFGLISFLITINLKSAKKAHF